MRQTQGGDNVEGELCLGAGERSRSCDREQVAMAAVADVQRDARFLFVSEANCITWPVPAGGIRLCAGWDRLRFVGGVSMLFSSGHENSGRCLCRAFVAPHWAGLVIEDGYVGTKGRWMLSEGRIGRLGVVAAR